MSLRLQAASLCLLIVIGCVGCSDGSGTNQTPKSGIGPYLPYFGGFNLHVLDTANSTTQQITSSYIIYATQLHAYSVNDTTHQISNAQPAELIYINNGQFMKMDLRAGSNLIPVAFSKVSNICLDYDSLPTIIQIDPTNPESSLIFYQTPASSAGCSPGYNKFYKIHVSDTVKSEPVEVNGTFNFDLSIMPLYDPANLAAGIQEILAIEGNNLVRYDRNFENPATVYTGSNYLKPDLTPSLENTDGFFFMEGEKTIHMYNRASGAVITNLLNAPDNIGNYYIYWDIYKCNSTHCFFDMYDRFTNLLTIYSIPIDGSASATAIYPAIPDSSNYNTIAVTDNYIILSYTEPATATTNTTQHIINLKADGSDTVVNPIYSIEANKLEIWDPANVYNGNSHVCFAAVTATTRQIICLPENGETIDTPIIKFENAQFVGYTDVRYTFTGASRVNVNYLFATNIPNYDMVSMAGGTLVAFDTATSSQKQNLGTIPAGIETLSITGLGSQVLGVRLYFNTNSDPTTSQDIMFVDSGRADSMRQITNTPNVKEGIVRQY